MGDKENAGAEGEQIQQGLFFELGEDCTRYSSEQSCSAFGWTNQSRMCELLRMSRRLKDLFL